MGRFPDHPSPRLARAFAGAPALIAASLTLAPLAGAQPLPSVVIDELEISEGSGGFGGDLSTIDSFGYAVESIGDLDGDGVPDLAVGTNLDDDGGFFVGAVWILFMHADGTVKAEQKISALSGGFGGVLMSGDRFGSGVASLGDLDGDGVTELAVGTAFANTIGTDSGSVWILFLNTDGTVKNQAKIDNTLPALAGLIPSFARFGRSVESLGDLDGDGLSELAVGAWKDGSGSAFVLFLDSAGGVTSVTKIAEGLAGFDGDVTGNFGTGLARLGDLDGDGVTELAVGANAADDYRGEAWVLFLNAGGSVKAHRRIAPGDGGFDGELDVDDLFGTSLAPLPDRDGNGISELAVGAVWDDDGVGDGGAVWVLYLQADGGVASWQKISDTEGGFTGGLTSSEYFGGGIAAIDTDGDGHFEMAVGAGNDNDFIPMPETGSVWLLTLNPALWRDHGLGLAGSLDAPRLVGTGALTAGTPMRFSLSGTQPGQLASFIVGVSVLGAPFKGGTMFPTLDLLTAPTPTDALGELELGAIWPAGVPSHAQFFAQAWVLDGAGPAGFAASNGASGTTP